MMRLIVALHVKSRLLLNMSLFMSLFRIASSCFISFSHLSSRLVLDVSEADYIYSKIFRYSNRRLITCPSISILHLRFAPLLLSYIYFFRLRCSCYIPARRY